ncbi:hypothetical protein NHQ30_002570 [Ciborinia camelliae]|nr:hypothetical protein NHQ30_002570 [Ciborinia camelliae]
MHFLAPEFFREEDAPTYGVGFEADIWALGVVMFECLKGYSPFGDYEEYEEDEEEDEEKEQRELERVARMRTQTFIDAPPRVFSDASPEGQDYPDVSSDAEDLFRGMLEANFNKRWTAEKCLRHPWIRGLPAHQQT